jgi:hypothetical protein
MDQCGCRWRQQGEKRLGVVSWRSLSTLFIDALYRRSLSTLFIDALYSAPVQVIVRESNKRLDIVDKGLEVVDKRLDVVDKGLDVVDKRLDVVDKGLDVVDKRLDVVEYANSRHRSRTAGPSSVRCRKAQPPHMLRCALRAREVSRSVKRSKERIRVKAT